MRDLTERRVRVGERTLRLKKKMAPPFRIQKMKDLAEFRAACQELGYHYPLSEDLSVLHQPLELNGKIIPNRLCIQPCEGFDGNRDGDPGELTFRRYRRYAEGGAGLIWFEAVGVSNNGKGNPLQMMLTSEARVEPMKRLVDATLERAAESRGIRPYLVVQLTHAGRTCFDEFGKIQKRAVVFNPYKDLGREHEIHYLTDEEIVQAEDDFVQAAEYAMRAGFDGVDIKICHHYLLRELLSAVTRPGMYGGSFENRSRAIFNIIRKIRARVGDKLEICVRMNAYDCWRWPFGWGMADDGSMRPDLTEPILLVQKLVEQGVRLIDVSTNLPRYSPYGKGEMAEYDDETPINPYEGVHHLLNATREIKAAVPEAMIVSTGLTWFSQFGPQAAAGGFRDGWFDLAGFGRQPFAYPDFAKDILDKGALNPSKCCVFCDNCYNLISNGRYGGCVVRDAEIYAPMYLEMMGRGKKQ